MSDATARGVARAYPAWESQRQYVSLNLTASRSREAPARGEGEVVTAGSYRLEPDRPELGAPVLVHGLTGFMDAGGASRLAIEHLLESCEHSRVATFDIDALFDYRGRRPRTVFDSDHYESVAMPELVVDAAVDEHGERFLVLHGSEPDTAWGAVSHGIVRLIDALGVRLVVGMHAIPWPAPHTRPINVTVHANDPDAHRRHPALGGLPGGAGEPRGTA